MHWNDNLERIKGRIGEETFGAWIAPIVVEADDGKTIKLLVPTKTFEDFINRNFGSDLEEILERKIEFHVQSLAARGAEYRIRKHNEEQGRERRGGD